MNKYAVKGFLIGILIVPVATLGLAIRFIEVAIYPLIIVPKYVATSVITAGSIPGGISIAFLALLSGLFYGLIGYLYSIIKNKTNGITAVLFLIVVYAVLAILVTIPPANKNVSEKFTPQETNVEGRTGLPCETNADCPLPIDYAIRSICPFQAACIEGACAVICPMWEHSPNPEESISYAVSCREDSDCDCSEWDSENSYECACVDGTCGSVIER